MLRLCTLLMQSLRAGRMEASLSVTTVSVWTATGSYCDRDRRTPRSKEDNWFDPPPPELVARVKRTREAQQKAESQQRPRMVRSPRVHRTAWRLWTHRGR